MNWLKGAKKRERKAIKKGSWRLRAGFDRECQKGSDLK